MSAQDSSQVYVYYNLKRKVWSIASVSNSGNGRDKLIRHASELTLIDARFVVSEATRQTVIRKNERNVHAGVIGTLVEYQAAPSDAAVITYNPYRGPKFNDKATGAVVESFAHVSFGSTDKYARGWS